MKTLLIVDDEQKIRSLIKTYSKYEGYLSFECENGKECIDFLRANKVDLVILDVMMPVLDGFSTLNAIREFSTVPVIMLTAKSEEEDKIKGFLSGADDYVQKPFSPKELMLRINAVLKRVNTSSNKVDCGIRVDRNACKVFIDDNLINLSFTEYELLLYFLDNSGIALSREQIIDNVWKEFDGFDRTVDAHVKSLRKKLYPYSDSIQTVRGIGYRFEK